MISVAQENGMSGWLESVWSWLPSHKALAGQIVFASLVIALIYAAFISLAVTRMSPDYFVSRRPSEGSWRMRHPAARVVMRILKNILGIVILLAGVAMLVLPGQGMLTILLGLSLIDFPGKRKLELRIVRQRQVLKAINWIRAKAEAPPLIIPPPDKDESEDQ